MKRLVAVVLALVALIFVAQPHAQAVGIPFVNVCEASAPLPMTPKTGLSGLLTERPNMTTPDSTPDHLFTSGGVGGFAMHTYDLGCAANPTTYARLADANLYANLSNFFIAISTSITALVDAIDHRAWSPQWISSFLHSFSERAADVVNRQIWLPLIGLGLIAATIFLLLAARKGDITKVASGSAWMFLVLLIGAFVLAQPVLLSQEAQSAGNGFVATLNNSSGTSASDSTTDSVVQAIQYQSWLRRTFGSDDTAVGTKYGPQLLAASRITWAEMDEVKAGKTTMAHLVDTKRTAYDDLAKKIKTEDPAAYKFLQGDPDVGTSSIGVSVLEAAYSLAAGAFRLMADLLMVTAVILLTMLGIVWVAASPWIVTPPGRGMGQVLLDNTFRCLAYVLAAAVAVKLFTVYLLVAMMPGMSAYWSVILLFIGTIIFWTALRPDRKMLSMLSMGRVDGTGKVVGTLKTLLLAYVGGKVAGDAVADRVVAAGAATSSEDVSAPPPAAPEHVVWGTATVPPAALPATASNQALPASGATPDMGRRAYAGGPDGQVLTVTHEPLPTGEQPYVRASDDVVQGEVITPPPLGTVGEVEVYQRPAPTDYLDEQVACPWCRGVGCGHCENEGTVPRWVMLEVTRGE